MQVELLQYELGAGPPPQEYDLRTADAGNAHVGISVSNVDAVVGAAEAIGWRNLGQTEDFFNLAKIAYMRGPDGETVELIEIEI